jgi:hypothetical protein
MRARPIIHPFFDEPTNTVTYIVADPTTKQAAVIDPVLDYDPNAEFAGQQEHTRAAGAIRSFRSGDQELGSLYHRSGRNPNGASSIRGHRQSSGAARKCSLSRGQSCRARPSHCGVDQWCLSVREISTWSKESKITIQNQRASGRQPLSSNPSVFSNLSGPSLCLQHLLAASAVSRVRRYLPP